MKIVYCVIASVLACGIASSARKGSLVQQAPVEYAQLPNAYEGDPLAVRAGAKLFARECSACHGADAHGIGKTPPLVIPDVYRAAPGALLWVLTNGSLNRGMPSYAHLPEPQRWQLVTYLKTLR